MKNIEHRQIVEEFKGLVSTKVDKLCCRLIEIARVNNTFPVEIIIQNLEDIMIIILDSLYHNHNICNAGRKSEKEK